MNRYIALIRGINVGGNNKVSMLALKTELEKSKLSDIATYINSGNVIFSSPETSLVKLVAAFEQILEESFAVTTTVSVLSVAEFHEAVEHAPKWWGSDNDTKHNGLFVIAPTSADEIIKEVGSPKPEYEKIDSFKHVIFWSAPVATFGRTRWSKIVGTAAYKSVTIRNSNTIRKLYELTS